MANPTNRLGTFYALLVTQTFSLIGSNMTSVAVGIWVFMQTGRTTPLMLSLFFNELPGMLLGSAAGVLVDRWSRKWIMALADAGQALGSLALILSFTSGDFQLWHLYLVALLQGVFAAFQGPAESASITMLVPAGQRERANGILEMAFPLSNTLAPVLTGLFYPLVGVGGVLVIDMATFLVAACVLGFLKIPDPQRTDEGSAGRGSFLGELRAGRTFKCLREVLPQQPGVRHRWNWPGALHL